MIEHILVDNVSLSLAVREATGKPMYLRNLHTLLRERYPRCRIYLWLSHDTEQLKTEGARNYIRTAQHYGMNVILSTTWGEAILSYDPTLLVTKRIMPRKTIFIDTLDPRLLVRLS